MPAKLKLKRSCVIGWPVAHSRSPLIHNYWLKLHRLQGEYSRHPVRPEELDAFLMNLESSGYVGCNVTVPHKERAATLVTPADPLTLRLGAVNTVFLDDSRLMGTNTDAYGFAANLKATVPEFDPAGRHIIVLGAGGASRAVVGALLQLGVETVSVCNRAIERAQVLSQCFGSRVRAVAWTDVAKPMSDAALLVNATSLGMQGMPPLEIALDPLPRSAVVCDIVYVPLETALLRRARVRGHPTVDGLGMLLHQARPGFEKWFGVTPEVTAELRRLLEQDILNSLPLVR